MNLPTRPVVILGLAFATACAAPRTETAPIAPATPISTARTAGRCALCRAHEAPDRPAVIVGPRFTLVKRLLMRPDGSVERRTMRVGPDDERKSFGATRIGLAVEGLACANCLTHVAERLIGSDEVWAVQVDQHAQELVVHCADSWSSLDGAALAASLEAQGYSAREIAAP